LFVVVFPGKSLAGTNFILSFYFYIFVKQNVDGMEYKELTTENLEMAANMLKAIAHPIRISIVGCLEDGEKKTVTEIHNHLGIEQSTASHHLVILRDRGVLASKREGKNTWYYLKHPNLKMILSCIANCCQ
jgi:ArsR family transcriptional regulator, virulence genes transcriptional regulator